MNTVTTTIEAGLAAGVKVYTYIPGIVYGKGTGFGNKISIQTVAIVKAAKATGRVHRPDNLDGVSRVLVRYVNFTDFRQMWPVSHINDTAELYAQLLRRLLASDDIPAGKNGFYLASSGPVAWLDIYSAAARALHKRGVIDSSEVGEVSDAALEKAAEVLPGGKAMVPFHMGGK